MLPAERWHALPPGQDNLGYFDGEAWVRMRLHNTNTQGVARWVLEVPFTRMDELEWFVFQDGQLARHARSGSMRMQPQGALHARYPALSFGIPAGETAEIYVRMASETVLNAHFQLWEANVYMAEGQRRERLVALRMGMLIALLVLAYLFVWGFREVGSVWFPLTFTFFGIGMASLAGYWPDVDWLSGHFRVKTMLLLCSFWSAACLLLHARYFYELEKKWPRLSRWTLAMACLAFGMGGLSFWMPFRAYMRVAHLSIFMAFLAIFAITFTLYSRRASWWLNLAAYVVFFGYIFSQLAFDLGWLPVAIRADSLGFTAVSVSMLLFILAQVWRLRELHAAYDAAVRLNQFEREKRLEDQRMMLRDLHDGLGGMAATVSLMAAYGKRSADEAIKNNRLEAIERMSGYAGAEIRSLMNNLEQPAPSWTDWLNDLREYTEGVLEASHMELEWACAGKHPEQWGGFAPALSLMRAIKEAVHNAVKHAGATKVALHLAFREGRLEVRISDNGRGFDVHLARRGRGLSSMEKRVKELGGRFVVHSASNGTEIRVDVAASGCQPAVEKAP